MSNFLNNDIWDEDRLISGLRQGNESAFRALIRQYQGRLFGIAYGMTQDREESLDIVQEVFIKVFQKIRFFKKEAKLSTWLHRITVNQCLNLKRGWKRRLRWQHHSLENELDGDFPEEGSEKYNPQTRIENKEYRQALRGALQRLPSNAKIVFILKELEGLSYDEIAAILKIKRGTVSSRLFYARRKLRGMLANFLDKEQINDKSSTNFIM